MLKDLVLANRSRRRFYQDIPVEMETLRELVDLARLCASGRNAQPLKYILSNDPQKNALIFPNYVMAASIKWIGPPEGEKASAYIIILGDNEIKGDFDHDSGIAAQTIMLGAVEKGLGGCIIANVKRSELQKALNIPPRYQILLVLALGKPKEKVVVEEVGADGNTLYWRDKESVHHVPKRRLEEIILDL